MLKKALAIVIVNVCASVVIAEVLALAVFYYQHGWLFYAYPYGTTRETIAETADQRLTQEALHPYFGPTHRPGIPFDVPPGLARPRANGGGTPEAARNGQPAVTPPPRTETNNFGFVSPYNYPFVKTRREQFIVGIFGGSVGLWFCEVGVSRLLDDLKRNPYFRDRELVPICLSHEGYKQPQQLLVLSYFLSIGQPLDLVVNIDGFNEVSLSSLNDDHGLDISMPSFMHLDPLINLVNQVTLTPAKLELLAAISRDKQQLNRTVARMKRNRFASVNLALEQYYAVVDRRYRAALFTFSTLASNPSDNSIVRATPAVRSREGTRLFEDIAAQWVGASVLMHQLLAARSVPYFHVLQPNQDYTTRRFSPAEAAVALSGQSPFKISAEKGYPFLERALESGALKEGHVRAFNAVHIFDREPSAVYMDNCCHYTRAGNDILADFIAASILSTDGDWTRAGASRGDR